MSAGGDGGINISILTEVATFKMIKLDSLAIDCAANMMTDLALKNHIIYVISKLVV